MIRNKFEEIPRHNTLPTWCRTLLVAFRLKVETLSESGAVTYEAGEVATRDQRHLQQDCWGFFDKAFSKPSFSWLTR